MTTKIDKHSGSVHTRIPQELIEEVDTIAAMLDRSRNWVFNEAIKQYIEVQKWQTELIKERLTESKNANAKFLMHDEVMKKQEKKLKAKRKIRISSSLQQQYVM